jgi:hypothetical protein
MCDGDMEGGVREISICVTLLLDSKKLIWQQLINCNIVSFRIQ